MKDFQETGMGVQDTVSDNTKMSIHNVMKEHRLKEDRDFIREDLKELKHNSIMEHKENIGVEGITLPLSGNLAGMKGEFH